MKQSVRQEDKTTTWRSRSRRAYILIVVLGLATLVSTLGIAFIEANSTAMPAASNRKHAARAQYLAESGVELAKHYLLYPPTTVAINDYWHGGTNIAVDATSDFTNVTVTQHATIKDRFTIVAGGVSKDTDGTVKGKKAVRADVLLPPGNIWDIRYGLIGKSATTTIPAGVVITGNVHGNGSLTGSGTCTGEVSACSTATWLGGGPPTAVKSAAAAVPLPTAGTTPYTSYMYRGAAYSARLFDSNIISATEAAALNAIDMSSTNPGRVIRTRTGGFTLGDNVVLNGTLLVSGGDLDFQNAVQINAQPGFPGIVCTAAIVGHSDYDDMVVNGSVICGGSISDFGRKNVVLTARGATILTNSPLMSGSGSQFNFIWDADRSWLYNFESAPARQPITVLSWRED